MIGKLVTDKGGIPLSGTGQQLSKSTYQPSNDVKLLWARCQDDYMRAYRLQHRPFDEFDGVSLLERAKRDQETFAAFVGAQYIPKHKQWRWKGRKNTARDKIIGLLAHMIAAILYPMVYAQNQEDEEDKVTAQVMRILVEEHLRKAGYQMQFLYMALSALVNPAVFVSVEYLVAMQRIKERTNGKVQIIEAIDTLLSGLNLGIIPIDQILLGDFYTGDIQRQPYIVRVERISYDQAREIYGTHEDFQYVKAGKTRVLMTGNEHQTLFDIEWTEADEVAVQVATFYYRGEDIEVTFVGGVFMGTAEDPYNTNPFKHRRLSLIGEEWHSIPVYHIAKSGFEPIDPTGRFAYYKSSAFKEYWDDGSINKAYQLLQDGMYLDVIKPIIGTGIQKVDSTVVAPGAFITTTNKDATLTPWSLGPNLAAAMNVLNVNKGDVSDSTIAPILAGEMPAGRPTSFALNAMMSNAKILLGLFSYMLADLVRQIGELTVDEIVAHTTQGELDATMPEALVLKFSTILVKNKDKGRDITNKIIFSDALMGKKLTPTQLKSRAFDLLAQAGGPQTDQRIFMVDPYRFARTIFTLWVDPDAITASAIGLNRDQKMQNITMLTQPFVYPFVDQKALADEVIDEYGGNDADKLRKKPGVNDMMNAAMGGAPGGPGGTPTPNGGAPVVSPMQPANLQH